MPVYRFKHDCGYEGDQFLKQDKDTVVLKCPRCNRGVTARQVRDKTTVVKENNEVKGVFRHEHGGGINANQQ